jgi:hypothetical protein
MRRSKISSASNARLGRLARDNHRAGPDRRPEPASALCHELETNEESAVTKKSKDPKTPFGDPPPRKTERTEDDEKKAPGERAPEHDRPAKAGDK